jgi:hypothetical protein
MSRQPQPELPDWLNNSVPVAPPLGATETPPPANKPPLENIARKPEPNGPTRQQMDLEALTQSRVADQPPATSSSLPKSEKLTNSRAFSQNNQVVAAGDMGHASYGFFGGILSGVIGVAILAVLANVTHNSWLILFFLVGLLVGFSTRLSGDNRHGLLMQLSALLAAAIIFGLSVYGTILGLNKLQFLGWNDFQNQLQLNPLKPLDWVSGGVGLLVAFMIPFWPRQKRR